MAFIDSFRGLITPENSLKSPADMGGSSAASLPTQATMQPVAPSPAAPSVEPSKSVNPDIKKFSLADMMKASKIDDAGKIVIPENFGSPETKAELKFEEIIEIQKTEETPAVPQETIILKNSEIKTAEQIDASPEISKAVETVYASEKESTPKDKFSEDRVFVNEFLVEVNDILVAGINLEKMLNEKTNADGTLTEHTIQAGKMKTKRMEIGRQITELFSDDNTTGSSLIDLQTSFDNYMGMFTNENDQINAANLRAVNTLRIGIDGAKKKLQEKMKSVGGQEIFERIKRVVKVCEGARQKKLAESPVKEGMKQDISERVVRLVSTDLSMCKSFVQNNDMLSILMSMYMEQK